MAAVAAPGGGSNIDLSVIQLCLNNSANLQQGCNRCPPCKHSSPAVFSTSADLLDTSIIDSEGLHAADGLEDDLGLSGPLPQVAGRGWRLRGGGTPRSRDARVGPLLGP